MEDPFKENQKISRFYLYLNNAKTQAARAARPRANQTSQRWEEVVEEVEQEEDEMKSFNWIRSLSLLLHLEQ